ncbi:MAG: DUF4349 domain-containing protein [Oscillospiraceae bacterium]|nr:DUF4349 domain-containing protein [Oscillospiraceae bacterium]
MKKCLVWLLVLTLCAGLLAGCGGAKNAATESNRGEMKDAADGIVEYSQEVGTTALSDTSITTYPSTTSQKLIRKIYLDAETEDLDALLEAVMEKINQLGGYVEQQEIYHGSPSAQRRYRRGSLTIRIPAEKLDDFVAKVTEESNIVSSNETSDDVTLRYVAIQSRISALETEQTRLLELLAKAETTRDLLEIEERLTEVRTELEEITSQLRVMDNQVNYGTVNLSVSEVKEYTVVEEPETVWQRIGTGFKQSLKSIGNGFTEIFVFIVANLPHLVLWAIAGVGIWLIIRIARKKKKTKKTDTTP